MFAGHFEGADLPEDAMLTTMPVAPGDIVVLGRWAALLGVGSSALCGICVLFGEDLSTGAF